MNARPDPRLIAKVKIAQAQLRLDDDTYRDMLERVTGARSAARCSSEQLVAVLAECRRLGWAPAAPARKSSAKRHVRMVFALWGELDRSGVVEDGSRGALCAFVKRQTGLDDPEWLTARDAAKVTEGLKAMLRRAQGAGGGRR